MFTDDCCEASLAGAISFIGVISLDSSSSGVALAFPALDATREVLLPDSALDLSAFWSSITTFGFVNMAL